MGLASGASAGTMSGFGTEYQGFANVTIDNGARWSLGGKVASGTTVAFYPGGTGSLTLTSPAAMKATITGFGTGETLSLAGIPNATGVTLTSGNTLTITESSGPGVALRLDPGQVFTGETFTEQASAGATNITVAGGVTQTALNAAYYGILRTQPSAALVSQTAARIETGQTTLAQFESGLISGEEDIYTTLPALVTIAAFYGSTPAGQLLTTVATAILGRVIQLRVGTSQPGLFGPECLDNSGCRLGGRPDSNFQLRCPVGMPRAPRAATPRSSTRPTRVVRTLPARPMCKICSTTFPAFRRCSAAAVTPPLQSRSWPGLRVPALRGANQ